MAYLRFIEERGLIIRVSTNVRTGRTGYNAHDTDTYLP